MTSEVLPSDNNVPAAQINHIQPAPVPTKSALNEKQLKNAIEGILFAVGGKENVEEAQLYAATRIRITVRNKEAIKEIMASETVHGMMKVSDKIIHVLLKPKDAQEIYSKFSQSLR